MISWGSADRYQQVPSPGAGSEPGASQMQGQSRGDERRLPGLSAGRGTARQPGAARPAA